MHKDFFLLLSLLPIKYLNIFLPKKLQFYNTTILSIPIFFWNSCFIMVKFLFFNFNIIKFCNCFSILYVISKNIKFFIIYNIPLSPFKFTASKIVIDIQFYWCSTFFSEINILQKFYNFTVANSANNTEITWTCNIYDSDSAKVYRHHW